METSTLAIIFILIKLAPVNLKKKKNCVNLLFEKKTICL